MKSASGTRLVKKLTKNLIPTALALLLFTSFAQAGSYRFADDTSYEVDEGFRLTVDNPVGSIIVMKSRDGKLNIHSEKEVDAVSRDEAEEIKDEIEIVTDASESDVSIRIRYPERREGRSFWKQVFGFSGDRNGEVYLRIEVPTDVSLSLSATSADIEVSGIEGEFRLDLTSGNMRLSELTGPCRIDATSGDIEARGIRGDVIVSATSGDGFFENIDGDLEIDATSGDTEANWVSGSVRIEKSSGSSKLSKCSGDVDIHVTSGEISIIQRSGGLYVMSSSGDIYIESEMTGGDEYEINSTSGNITLKIPEEAGVDVIATTGSGDIDTEASIQIVSLGKNELEGRIGRGGKKLRLNSSSGNISLLTY